MTHTTALYPGVSVGVAISGNGKFLSTYSHGSEEGYGFGRVYEWKKHYLRKEAHAIKSFEEIEKPSSVYRHINKFNREGTLGIGGPYHQLSGTSGKEYHAAVWYFDDNAWSSPSNLPIPQGASRENTRSNAWATNAEGNLIGGIFANAVNEISPVVWKATDGTKTNWQITLLEDVALSPVNSITQIEGVRALNAAGDIAAGESRGYATVWKWNNNQWSKPVSLGQGSVATINGKGDLLGGVLNKNDEYFPVVWSGENYSNISYLKGENGEEIQGEVSAISANGKVIGGNIYVNNRGIATVWSSNNPNKAYILQRPKDVDDFNNETYLAGISDDGTIAMGRADFPEQENGVNRPDGGDSVYHLMVWIIKFNEKDGSIDSEALVKGSEIPDIKEITPIDLTITQSALQTLAKDSIKLLGMQHYGLWRLQQGCYTEQTGFCYALRNDYSNYAGIKDLTSGLTLGYQFGDGLLAGFNLDHSIYRQLPTSYKRSHSNLGMGLFARWQKDNWYVAPAMAWDYYDVKVKRPQLANTESEERTSRVNGFGLSLTLGQDFALKNNTKLGWYATLSHTKISRAQFSEKEVALPISFASMTLAENALALGLNLEMPIKDKLTFLAGVRVEQQLSAKSPMYQLESKLGKQQFEAKLNRTRGKLNVGLRYEVNPNFNIEFSPYVEQSIFDKKRYGAQLNFSGRF